MVVLDRAVDMVSPLPTQLTYEGLIDELLGVSCSKVRCQECLQRGQGRHCITLPRFGEAEKQKTVTLSSCEALHRDLRGLNWSAVGGRLRQQALDIQEMTDRGAGDIRGIKEVVDNLPKIHLAKQSLGIHTELAKLIKQSIKAEVFTAVLDLEQRLLLEGGLGGGYLEEVEDLVCGHGAPLAR